MLPFSFPAPPLRARRSGGAQSGAVRAPLKAAGGEEEQGQAVSFGSLQAGRALAFAPRVATYHESCIPDITKVASPIKEAGPGAGSGFAPISLLKDVWILAWFRRPGLHGREGCDSAERTHVSSA